MNFLKVWINKPVIKRAVLKQAKKNKSVVYGAQSMVKQLPFYLRRKTEDYDIISKKPKKSARELEQELDRKFGGDFFYVKPAQHPGTHKVMSRGVDGIKGTEDDVGIADYSKPSKPRAKTVVIKGIKHTTIAQEKRNKLKALGDPKYEFRWEKDKEDLKTMRLKDSFGRLKKGSISKKKRLRF